MNTSEIAALIDTNVLVYAADKASPLHEAAAKLRDNGISGRIKLCLCPQVLVEFYAVLTDPKRVEKPRQPGEVIGEIEKYLQSDSVTKIYPEEDTLPRTINLLRKYNLRRQLVFDAQLVATMLSNGISRIYTYNEEDFSKFEEITVLTP